jgi:hypothetical protein
MSQLPETVSSPVRALQPRKMLTDFATIAEAMQFAEMVKNASGMIPKNCLGNPGMILATIMAGQELGISPMASFRAFHIVEGHVVASYHFWVARLRSAGYKVSFPVSGPEKVVCRLVNPEGESHEEPWDKQRAMTAGLWNGKDNWRKYPETMLTARAVTSAGRKFAAEVMFGCYETSEMDEIIKDAEMSGLPSLPPTGTASEKVAAIVGAAVDETAIKIETMAKDCAAKAKALGLTRDNVFALMAANNLPQGRISDLSIANLEVLSTALDKEKAVVDAMVGEPGSNP